MSLRTRFSISSSYIITFEAKLLKGGLLPREGGGAYLDLTLLHEKPLVELAAALKLGRSIDCLRREHSIELEGAKSKHVRHNLLFINLAR